MKIGVMVLGCPKNVADISNFKGIMNSRGHKIVDDATKADLVLVDTCGFIEEAKKESIEEILYLCSLKEQKSDLKIIATGCLVQRYYYELKSEIVELDGLIGNVSPVTLANLIENETYFYFRDPDGVYPFFDRMDNDSYAYLKIGDGCDRNCAFCSIPSFKGKSKSRRLEDILNEARKLIENGVREIILVSQDTTQYGADLGEENYLANLLEKLNDIDGDFWIRVMYLHPDHINEAIINAIINLPKVVNYFDIPIQSGSSRILKVMGRYKDPSELKRLFGLIRSKEPGAVLRTTIMVGFPGETEETFRETLDFISEIKFNRLGGFVYSPEEGTPSVNMDITMPSDEAAECLKELLDTQDQISFELNQTLIGKKLKVLVEEKIENNLVARGYNSAPEIDGTVISNGTTEPGNFATCLIEEAYDHDIKGVILE